MTTRRMIQTTLVCANRLYPYLEDLHDFLIKLSEDEHLDEFVRSALKEYQARLNDLELIDEIVARLGTIKTGQLGDDK